MDVVLGVAVTGSIARLALVGSGSAGHDVIDQSVVDLADQPIETLTQTVVGTNRLLADESHRLVATRLCWTDHPKADRLRRALEDSGVHDVAVLSESQAVTALMRAAGRPGAVLVMDDETATLSIVDLVAGDEHAPPTLLASGSLAGAEATATLDTLMARLGDQPDAAGDLYLMGASTDLTQVADQLRDASTMRVEIPQTTPLLRSPAVLHWRPRRRRVGPTRQRWLRPYSPGTKRRSCPRPSLPTQMRTTTSWRTRWPARTNCFPPAWMATTTSMTMTTPTSSSMATPRPDRCGSAAGRCSSATR